MTTTLWIIFIVITLVTAFMNSLRQLFLVWGGKFWATFIAVAFYMINNISMVIMVSDKVSDEQIVKALVQGFCMGICVLFARVVGEKNSLCKESAVDERLAEKEKIK